MSVEMIAEGLEFRREAAIPLFHRGHDIGDFFADFIVEDRVIVELKAIEELQPWHSAQLLNYLRVSGKQIGLLINFGPETVEVKRRVMGAPGRSAEIA